MAVMPGPAREPHPLFNVKNLLGTIATMATLTFGMFVWDAERALTKLDAVDANSHSTAEQVSAIAANVNNLTIQQTGMAVELTDHEKRITVLETMDSSGQHHKTMLRGPRQ